MSMGGDVDSTAGMTGALSGAFNGSKRIIQESKGIPAAAYALLLLHDPRVPMIENYKKTLKDLNHTSHQRILLNSEEMLWSIDDLIDLADLLHELSTTIVNK